MKKICFIVTAEFVVKAFLLNHLYALSKIYEVTLIVNTSNPNFLLERGVNVKVIPLSIARDISLISDFSCLIQLIKIFNQQHFFAVHSVTPKAGLLAMLAASLVRTPLRIHTFTGQVWVTEIGFKRFLLKQIDCLVAFLTTHNIVDSPSQRKFLVDEKVMSFKKSIVFAQGSISGVDIARFKPDLKIKNSIRKQLNISHKAIIFLFLGRLTRDKGVLDLAIGFNNTIAGSAHLLFVGPDEQNIQIEIKSLTADHAKYIHFVGHTNLPEYYMVSADVLCLPSYREGFGTVIIEAAAAGIPSIGSNIYGITDAIADGQTGLLHEPHDINAIGTCIFNMMNNTSLRLKLGENARLRAIKEFDNKAITQEWLNFYQENIF